MKLKPKYIILMFFILPIFADVDYNSEIQPIFYGRCTMCHGASGGLSLVTYDNVMNGGNSGEVVIPYDSQSSLLWQYIDSGFMPPNNVDLTINEIELIAQWIDEGALSEANTQITGDVNDDGFVNIQDIIITINIILELGEYNDLADINNDGVINILDIIELVNIILEI